METPGRMEPCGLEEEIPERLELAVDLALMLQKAVRPAPSSAELEHERREVRVMNAHFSLKLEGIDVPIFLITRALSGESLHGREADLAQAAIAHIDVEAWIDDLHDRGQLPAPTDADFLREVHRKLYYGMPVSMRELDDQDVIPGEYRLFHVSVGRHLPPSPHCVPDFMAHFQKRYRGLTSGDRGKVLAIPAAHHRFSYIHPFQDGNGRVARLMTHAMMLRAGLCNRSPWSISYALCEGQNQDRRYHEEMALADTPRQGDRDGRGNLSLCYLEHFTEWFLEQILCEISDTIGTGHASPENLVEAAAE
ncbi:hypothetical protein AYJ57_20980 (plasmid) [Salipiger sp. CCB-MM3]|uniref:Fic family protein n=1 Tax=Salipiger sp. CCB-MM3 TaxID=1792508 RepID=UPI00080ABA9D|nr:Fic family protein [Salipiger sp. CCB-MM3]ANT62953.1 hypothetical protein AYJ57_20980 [Salipiger sp. CCB-MM3]